MALLIHSVPASTPYTELNDIITAFNNNISILAEALEQSLDTMQELEERVQALEQPQAEQPQAEDPQTEEQGEN